MAVNHVYILHMFKLGCTWFHGKNSMGVSIFPLEICSAKNAHSSRKNWLKIWIFLTKHLLKIHHVERERQNRFILFPWWRPFCYWGSVQNKVFLKLTNYSLFTSRRPNLSLISVEITNFLNHIFSSRRLFFTEFQSRVWGLLKMKRL